MLVHLYGVVASSSPTPENLEGRAGRPVRFIEDDALRVIVSDIEDEARVGRQDLLAHAHVLEAFADQTTVVPVVFGVLLPDDDTVRREFLEGQREDLLHMLGGFDGLVQVTVQAQHLEEQALREVLQRDPDLVGLREAAKQASPHDPIQMRLGEAVTRALEILQDDDAAMLLDRLAPYARAVWTNETRGALEVLNVALLVERSKRGELDAAVSLLAEEVSSRIRIRYVGPQPPYSFLEPMRSGELSWA